MPFIQLGNKEKHTYMEDFTPNIEVIAFALAHINRYTGHVGQYSVAQHCVLMAQQAPDEIKLDALLHDAPEAFINDIANPLKALLPDYKEIENFYHGKFDAYYGVSTKQSFIKFLDVQMLVTEAKHFGLNLIVEEFPHVTPLDIEIKKLEPIEAYTEYLLMFNKLTGGKFNE